MMTSSNGNLFRDTGPFARNSPITGELSSQRPLTRIFDVFFDLRLNKRLSKQSIRRWFETPSRTLWRHRNELSNAHINKFWRNCKPSSGDKLCANSCLQNVTHMGWQLTSPVYNCRVIIWHDIQLSCMTFFYWRLFLKNVNIGGLVQTKRNTSAPSMELRLSCTNLSIC